MDSKRFSHRLRELSALTPQQVARIHKQLATLRGLPETAEHLEKGVTACPHCGSARFIHWGCNRGIARFRCQECRRTFSPLTGTPLSGLHYPERWTTYSERMVAGESVRKSAKACGIHRNTAFRWRHRFLNT